MILVKSSKFRRYWAKFGLGQDFFEALVLVTVASTFFNSFFIGLVIVGVLTKIYISYTFGASCGRYVQKSQKFMIFRGMDPVTTHYNKILCISFGLQMSYLACKSLKIYNFSLKVIFYHLFLTLLPNNHLREYLECLQTVNNKIRLFYKFYSVNCSKMRKNLENSLIFA